MEFLMGYKFSVPEFVTYVLDGTFEDRGFLIPNVTADVVHSLETFMKKDCERNAAEKSEDTEITEKILKFREDKFEEIKLMFKKLDELRESRGLEPLNRIDGYDDLKSKYVSNNEKLVAVLRDNGILCDFADERFKGTVSIRSFKLNADCVVIGFRAGTATEDFREDTITSWKENLTKEAKPDQKYFTVFKALIEIPECIRNIFESPPKPKEETLGMTSKAPKPEVPEPEGLVDTFKRPRTWVLLSDLHGEESAVPIPPRLEADGSVSSNQPGSTPEVASAE